VEKSLVKINLMKAFSNIDTVHGVCEECNEDTILVAIVTEFYRCTNCGHDTKQHVNGSIRYLKLSESDKKFIKEHGKTEV
jgi:uncharacterized protein (DUF983 family)